MSSVLNSISSDNMFSHEKTLNVLLTFVTLLRICCALQINSCIRYETYLVTDYKMTPFDFSDGWFSHSFHFSPRKLTRVGLRSRRLYGCCDPGYQFKTFGCLPICISPCPKNSHCSSPGQCSCNVGYQSISGSDCVSNDRTTEEPIETTTREITSAQPPCNGSCATNEECSPLEDSCICRDGFQRSIEGNASTTCVPKCEPECQHADCTHPNTCSCWPHYERTNASACHLQCSEQTCVYGECDGNGTCVCAQGFLNNGTACVWAGDAILSEPDECDCWSQFVWQKNRTQSDNQQCVPLCDEDDPVEVSSGCIDFKQCQCYEGFLVCHAQMYKCSAMAEVKSNSSSTLSYLAEKVDQDKSSQTKLILLIAAFLAAILITGAILWIWQKRRNWLNRLWNYRHMESGQEGEQI